MSRSVSCTVSLGSWATSCWGNRSEVTEAQGTGSFVIEEVEISGSVLSPSQAVSPSLDEVIVIRKAWAQSSCDVESDESSLDLSGSRCLDCTLRLGSWCTSALGSSAINHGGGSSSSSGCEDNQVRLNELFTAEGKAEDLTSLNCSNDSHAGSVCAERDLGIS